MYYSVKMIKQNRTKGWEAKYNNRLFDQPGFLAQVHTYKLRAFPGKKINCGSIGQG